MMRPTETFSIGNFEDLVEYVGIGENGLITLHTKAKTKIAEEGDDCYGCDENTEEDGNGN